MCCASSLFGEVVYSSITSPLPPAMLSQPYQAQQTAEFGNSITLAGTNRVLGSVSVVMASWAYASAYSGSGAGFYHPITLNLYNTTNTDAVGPLVASKTVNTFIAWRPEPTPGCPGTQYLASDALCHNSATSIISFDFSSSGVVLPDSLIYGIAYNTQSWGANPTGVNGPYNSLNVGLEGAAPSIGSNNYSDSAYWNTVTAAWYADGGSGGTGTFRRDTGWAGYEANIQITATPEPGTFALFGGAVALFGALRRRSRRS